MPCRLNIPDPTLRNTIPLTDPLTDQYSGLCKCPQMFDVRDSRDRPDVPLGVTRELTSLVWETSPVRATAHLRSNRRRARLRLAGDAPRRLHLRDSPWDRSDGRDQSPLPVCLLLAGRILRGGCPRVIVGNDDSDYAVIPFVVQMVTLGHD